MYNEILSEKICFKQLDPFVCIINCDKCEIRRTAILQV